MRVRREERGLVGKLIALWLLVIAVVVIGAIDAGSIVLARVRTADVARDAASAGAKAFDESGGRRRPALQAALAAIVRADENTQLEDFEVSETGRVTVVVTDRAGTILLGHIGFLDDLTNVRASSSSDG